MTGLVLYHGSNKKLKVGQYLLPSKSKGRIVYPTDGLAKKTVFATTDIDSAISYLLNSGDTISFFNHGKIYNLLLNLKVTRYCYIVEPVNFVEFESENKSAGLATKYVSDKPVKILQRIDLNLDDVYRSFVISEPEKYIKIKDGISAIKRLRLRKRVAKLERAAARNNTVAQEELDNLINHYVKSSEK